jgi:hypothetical protein
LLTIAITSFIPFLLFLTYVPYIYYNNIYYNTAMMKSEYFFSRV